MTFCNKNLYKKIILLSLPVIIVVLCCGCIKTNDKITKAIIPKLESKYNCSFTPVSIGNRMDSETATLIIEDENGVRFTAVVSSNTEEVEDDYIRCVIAEKLNNNILKEFKDAEIEACCRTIIICDNCSMEENRNISLEEFVSKYNLKEIMLYLSMNQASLTESKIYNVMDGLCAFSEENNIELSASSFSLSSENYERCSQNISTAYDVNNTWFDDYQPLNNTVFNIKGNRLTPKIDKLVKTLI